MSSATAPPVAMDFLWVIDHSASSGRAQTQLEEAAPALMARLATLDSGRIDAQAAVVSIQQAPDKQVERVIGRFRHAAGTAYPPSLFESVRTPCLNHAQCAAPTSYSFQSPSDSSLCSEPAPAQPALQQAGKWKCQGPKTENGKIKSSAVSNYNCSINTRCSATCTKGPEGDAFCKDLFGAGRTCEVAGGGAGVGGCIRQPATQNCPKSVDLPAVLGQGQFDSLHCLTTMGVSFTQESHFEGAFRSAWLALDPAGPNCSYPACVDSLRSCCTKNEKWCTETKPEVVKQNIARCEKEKVELCEFLTPYGRCKRTIPSCCQGPHDLACLSHKDKAACEAEVSNKCGKRTGASEQVPQACQNTRLLRPDGYLVLIFVSDNDECSMRMQVADPKGSGAINLHPHDKRYMTKEIWEKCQVHNDVELGNRELLEARCEFKRDKVAGMGQTLYCPVDCRPGSTATTAEGKAKCANGCKSDSAERTDCLAKAAARISALEAEYRQFHAYRSAKEHLAGWQFAAVSDYAKRFKSLKKRPGQVMVVAFGGDSRHGEHNDSKLAELEAAGKPLYTKSQQAQRHRDRVAYLYSELFDAGPGEAPSICLGTISPGRWSGRLIKMAKAFGDKGIVRNYCRDQPWKQVMPGIADRLYSQAADLCLPAPPTPEGEIIVKRAAGKKTETLTPAPCASGGSKMNYCIRDAPHCGGPEETQPPNSPGCKTNKDCAKNTWCMDGNCKVWRGALHVIGGRVPDETIEVSYDAVIWPG